MMKKNYLKPEMEVTEVKVESFILAGSPQEDGTPGITGGEGGDESDFDFDI